MQTLHTYPVEYFREFFETSKDGRLPRFEPCIEMLYIEHFDVALVLMCR